MLLGIEEHVWIVGLLLGGVVSASINQMRPKRHIPLAEIYLKKGGVIVWFVDASNNWWPWALKKTRQGYFPMYTDKVKGLFKINQKFKPFYIGGNNTPNYVINTADMNSFDPIEIGKVNDFLDVNGIRKLRKKDIKHFQKLKSISFDFKRIRKNESARNEQLNQDMDIALGEAKKRIDEINEQKKTNYTLDEKNAVYYLIDYMLRHSYIDEQEADTLLYKFENQLLNLEGIKSEINQTTDVRINKNYDTSIDKIVDDFGSQNPLELTGVIDDARTNVKELKKMTPVPVKQFIPGGVILAIGISIIMGIAVIGGNPDLISGLVGDLKLPGLP